MKTPSLEDMSLWYKYKTSVWNEKSPESITIHNIMRIIRSIYTNELAYLSVPISSGLLFYDTMIENGELGENQINSIKTENYRIGFLTLKSLKERLNMPIIFPADMVPIEQNWEQAHFQALWLSIIAEKCTELHMARFWQYSNGATEELTHTFQLKLGLPNDDKTIFYNTKEGEERSRERMKSIKIYDYKGNHIYLDEAHSRIGDSINFLEKNGFEDKSKKLKQCLKALAWTEDRIEEGFYQ